MNTDIRIAVDFWQHHKTKKLIRRVGIEGARSLQILWSWAAGNRSNGILSGMDEDDIEFVADWNGEAGAFTKALVDLHWIDTEDGNYILHEWQEHNPWAADAEARGDKARLSRLRQVNPAAYEKCVQEGKTAISQREYDELKNRSGERQRNASETPADSQRTPAESPAPSPSLIKDIKNTKVFLSKSQDFDATTEQGSLVDTTKEYPVSKYPRCPQEKMLALYREILPELSQPRQVRPNVAVQVRARWVEKFEEKGLVTEDDGLAYFRNFFSYVASNDFLMGRKNSGGRIWRCDYAWLMKAANFDKVTNGFYGDQA